MEEGKYEEWEGGGGREGEEKGERQKKEGNERKFVYSALIQLKRSELN